MKLGLTSVQVLDVGSKFCDFCNIVKMKAQQMGVGCDMDHGYIGSGRGFDKVCDLK